MKTNNSFKRSFLSIVFICSIFFCFTQCKQDAAAEFNSKGGLRAWIGLGDTSPESDNGSIEIRNHVMKVLRNRIEYYGVTPRIEWLEAERQILLEIPDVKEPKRVLELLQSETNLEFWETHELTDVYASLVSADERLAQLLTPNKENGADKPKTKSLSNSDQKNEPPTDELDALLETVESSERYENSSSYQDYETSHPLFAKLTPNMYQKEGAYHLVPGPIIGYAQKGDMDQVMEYLNMAEIKSILPSDLVFRWAAKSTDEGGNVYGLFALKKTTRQGAVLDGSVITEAKAESDGQGGNAISLQMNEEGARMWARVTKDNVGKYISMVVDGQVYSAPRVNSEITGGRSQISGGFTKEEATDMANLLNAGKMPVPVRILKHEMVVPNLSR